MMYGNIVNMTHTYIEPGVIGENERYRGSYKEYLDNAYPPLPQGSKFLTGINDNGGYEVDVTEVWSTPTGYAVLTASGCSCWSGDYKVGSYATLDEVRHALAEMDYGPSEKSINSLISAVLVI